MSKRQELISNLLNIPVLQMLGGPVPHVCCMIAPWESITSTTDYKQTPGCAVSSSYRGDMHRRCSLSEPCFPAAAAAIKPWASDTGSTDVLDEAPGWVYEMQRVTNKVGQGLGSEHHRHWCYGYYACSRQYADSIRPSCIQLT